jgi:hypothetical protein
MSQPTSEILYPLVPSFYRQRDLEAGEPLRALLAVMEGELRRIDANLSSLYENWFIETCEDWVVPYIAELLGISSLPRTGVPGFNQRSYVATVLANRRRKGTSSLLLKLAGDTTAWTVRLVEFARLVATTQHLLLPQRAPRNIDLREPTALRRLDGPFDSLLHTAELRNIPRHGGRYNLPSVGWFFWRLRSYRIEWTAAGVPESSPGVPDTTPGRYTFDPLGRSLPLFNPVRSLPDLTASDYTTPAALGHCLLREMLCIDQRRAAATPAQPLLYFGSEPVLSIRHNGLATPIAVDKIQIADLQAWNPTWDSAGLLAVAVDPELGRLQFSPTLISALSTAGTPLGKVKVSYSYGFSGDIGGGSYDRSEPLVARPPASFLVCASDPSKGASTLSAAIDSAMTRWMTDQSNPVIIEILDNERYYLPKKLSLPGSMQLVIRAANQRRPVCLLDSSSAPATTAPSASGVYFQAAGSTLTLDGLLFGRGIVRTYAQSNNRLTLRHCTLLPAADGTAGKSPWPSVQLLHATGAFSLSVEKSITGPLLLPTLNTTLEIRDSIIDGAGTAGLSLSADQLSIERCTVLGRSSASQLPLASDCIFTDVVQIVRTQPGCMRFCYVPSGESGDPASLLSVTPPRYRCQPDGALFGQTDLLTRRQIRSDLLPRFTATQCGQPGYAQLSQLASDLLRRGGSDDSEPGAFYFLHQPQREANLRAALQEFLRFGYEAGVFYVN